MNISVVLPQSHVEKLYQLKKNRSDSFVGSKNRSVARFCDFNWENDLF